MSFLGGAAITRAFFGADVLVRAWLAARWLYSRFEEDRDEIGNAVKQVRTVPMALYSFVVSTGVTGLGFLAMNTDKHWLYLALACAVVIGPTWGMLCGIGQSLPVEPRLLLTTAVDEGVVLRYECASR